MLSETKIGSFFKRLIRDRQNIFVNAVKYCIMIGKNHKKENVIGEFDAPSLL